MEAAAITPNYDDSMVDVYAQATILVVKERSDIGILVLVEAPGILENTILPSQVPNYNIRPQVQPLTKWLRTLYQDRRQNTAEGLSYRFASARELSGLLRLEVEGFYLNKIQNIGPIYKDLDRALGIPGLLYVLQFSIGEACISSNSERFLAFSRALITDSILGEPVGNKAGTVLLYLVAMRISFVSKNTENLRQSIEILAKQGDITQVAKCREELKKLGYIFKRTEQIVRELATRIPEMPNWEVIYRFVEELERGEDDSNI